MTDAVEPDYTSAWEIGWEHICQEGQDVVRKRREAAGFTREEIWEMSGDEPITPGRLADLEGDHGALDIPTLDELFVLARVFFTTPAILLSEMVELPGKRLVAERDGIA